MSSWRVEPRTGYEGRFPWRVFLIAVAVVTVRRHYLNGIEVGVFAEAGPPTTSPDPVRIGSDVSFEFAPEAALDEFRLWSVARSQPQIQSTMNTARSWATPSSNGRPSHPPARGS